MEEGSDGRTGRGGGGGGLVVTVEGRGRGGKQSHPYDHTLSDHEEDMTYFDTEDDPHQNPDDFPQGLQI